MNTQKMTHYKTDRLDLHLMDCMELMAQFPDKHFDLAIVDPPYGIGMDGYSTNTKNNAKWKNKVSKVYPQKKWDSKTPDVNYFRELFRVSKNQIIWGANHFISKIPYDSPCWILWDKKNDGKMQADCEMAWTSFKTTVRMFRFLWDGMRQEDISNKEHRIHPTQKPIALYRWLLSNYAKAGDKILDTHLGSMSHAIAAHYAGLHLTGCELDPDYFAAGIERVKRETAQMDMFADVPKAKVIETPTML